MSDTVHDRRRAAWAAALLLALAAGCATTDEAPSPAAAPAAEEPAAAPAPAPEPRVTREDVRRTSPARYTVRRGDTLWDIAARFLRDPWVWPEIWQVNPAIENPHLIYPGDVITLAYIDGEPRLIVDRPDLDMRDIPVEPGVRRLEPGIRRMPVEEAIASIPADAIRQFLNRPRVITRAEMDHAPYIIGNHEGRLISGEGQEVFARGFDAEQAGRYSVFRPGSDLVDPDTGEVLGYEAIYAGEAAVRDYGDPTRLQLTRTEREVLNGDRLLPMDREIAPQRYIPRIPEETVDGRIIALFDAITQVAANQVVVINRGTREGMEVGTMLGIDQSGGTIRDTYSGTSGTGELVELPARRVGTMMVFRPYERVSYALIMQATRSIQLHDRVTNP